MLPAYLGTRRWFAAKDQRIRAATLGERGVWKDWLLMLVTVEFDDRPQQVYFLPLSSLWELPQEEVTAGMRAATLGRIRRHAASGILVDAFADERFVRALVEAIATGDSVALGSSCVAFTPTNRYGGLHQLRTNEAIRLLSEGTMSAAALDDRFFLKGYRRLCTGIDPAIEIRRHLIGVSSFPGIVPLAGWVEHVGVDGQPTTLAVLEGYVPNQGDLWGFTLVPSCPLQRWVSFQPRAANC